MHDSTLNILLQAIENRIVPLFIDVPIIEKDEIPPQNGKFLRRCQYKIKGETLLE